MQTCSCAVEHAADRAVARMAAQDLKISSPWTTKARSWAQHFCILRRSGTWVPAVPGGLFLACGLFDSRTRVGTCSFRSLIYYYPQFGWIIPWPGSGASCLRDQNNLAPQPFSTEYRVPRAPHTAVASRSIVDVGEVDNVYTLPAGRRVDWMPDGCCSGQRLCEPEADLTRNRTSQGTRHAVRRDSSASSTNEPEVHATAGQLQVGAGWTAWSQVHCTASINTVCSP